MPLTCPMGILSPRGEGDVRNCKAHKHAKYIPSFKVSPTSYKSNFFLVPWGEDAHRAGEGLPSP